MKAKVFLSAFTGFLFGLFGYFVLLLLGIDQPFQLVVLSGLLFALLLFPVLVVYGNIMDKRYAKFEKEITSVVRKMHGRTIHAGKKPKIAGEDKELLIEYESLLLQKERAGLERDFEKMNKLSDKILDLKDLLFRRGLI